MATEKPRFSITVSDDVYQQINDYQHEHRLPTQTKAVLAFIEKGLEVIQNEKKPPTRIIEVEEICDKSKSNTQATPHEMEHLVKKYRLLDPYGKEAVDGVLDVESRRCEAARKEQMEQASETLRKSREQSEAAEEIAPEDIYSIPLYSLPMSAGTGQEAGQEYPEDFLLKKRPPRGTSFIARVSGNSMEPTYHNGDLVFIHATVDIRPSQTGAFLMDGQLWIKELGDGILISHNPDYEPRQFTEDIRCQGLVLGVCDESYFE